MEMNNGEYFAAHEVLEGAWRHAAEPEKTFLKGLIHASVALYQYGRGNGHGARVKYLSCVRYLAPYREGMLGLEVHALLEEMERYFAALLALPPGGVPPAPAGPPPRVRLREDGLSGGP